MKTCPSCGSNEIDFNDAGGDAICTSCGSVIEENAIVSDRIEFQENPSGSSSVIGTFVSATCSKPFSSAGGPGPGFSRESREITIENGRRRIAQLASSLRLGQHYVDSAHRLFMLAVQRNFVQGRKTSNVVAACLYIVCRREKSPHLLIDFSDVLQTNVYVLGSCFLKFCRLLSLRLPIIDPSLFIHRFAAKLEFGDKAHAVAMTALRLVASMKRDWMETGRRPSGICGAALLIAARTHNFRRTQKEIVDVVHVCDETLRLRLNEFEMTPSGQLTIEQFERLEMENECDPPSFLKARLEEKQKQYLEWKPDSGGKTAKELWESPEENQDPAKDAEAAEGANNGGPLSVDSGTYLRTYHDKSTHKTVEETDQNEEEGVKDAGKGEREGRNAPDSIKTVKKRKRKRTRRRNATAEGLHTKSKRKPGEAANGEDWSSGSDDGEDEEQQAVEGAGKEIIRTLAQQGKRSRHGDERREQLRSLYRSIEEDLSASSLSNPSGKHDSSAKTPSDPTISSTNEVGGEEVEDREPPVHPQDRSLESLEKSAKTEGELSDLDDEDLDDVDSFILNAEEVQRKTEVWTAMNKTFLEEQAARSAEAEATRKTKRDPLQEQLEANLVDDRTKARISSKINYDALGHSIKRGEATSGIVGISLPLRESDKLPTNAASAPSAAVEFGRKEPEDEEEDEDEEDYEEEHVEAEALNKGRAVEEEGEEEEMEVVVEEHTGEILPAGEDEEDDDYVGPSYLDHEDYEDDYGEEL